MKEKHIWNKNLEDLCWQNFMETGEIGYYLLCKDLAKEDERNSNKRHCAKGNKPQRKR